MSEHPLVKRKNAAQATINKFLNQPFVWGSNDCVHLAAHCLVGLGHPDPLEGLAEYDTALGAKRAMTAFGVSRFEDHLDNLGFERIAPARALPCDIWSIPSDDPTWPALGIFIQHDRVLAFAEGGCIWLTPSKIPPALSQGVVCWRVS